MQGRTELAVGVADRSGVAITRSRKALVVVCLLVMAACSAEERPSGPLQVKTGPSGPADPRIAAIKSNAYQLSQGGRYFSWYGCTACHSESAKGAVALGDRRRQNDLSFDRIYLLIESGHPRSRIRIPVEQLWQMTAYVRSLQDLPSAKRRRQDLDQRGEPQGSNWTGPVR
jgi:mono/diheme cytochrome c family protein